MPDQVLHDAELVDVDHLFQVEELIEVDQVFQPDDAVPQLLHCPVPVMETVDVDGVDMTEVVEA